MSAARKSKMPDTAPNLFGEDVPATPAKPYRTKERTASAPANDDALLEAESEGDLFDASGPIKLEPEELELRGRP